MAISEHQRLFGLDAAHVLAVVSDVTESTSSTLSTVSVDSFVKLMDIDLGEAMKVYWTELLQRAHLAALGSLLRMQRWVDGAVAMEADQNLLGFAACLRGILEAAADTAYSLRNIPINIAREAAAIQLALDGKVNKGVLASEDLENELLHFQFADKKNRGDARTDTQVAKRPFEYMKALDWDESGLIRDLYGELSALTHPSSHSLGSKPDSHEFGLRRKQDEYHEIHSICERHPLAVDRAIVFPCNTSLLLLKLLNSFGLDRVSTRVLERFDASAIPAWKSIRSAVRESAKSPALDALGLGSATPPRVDGRF